MKHDMTDEAPTAGDKPVMPGRHTPTKWQPYGKYDRNIDEGPYPGAQMSLFNPQAGNKPAGLNINTGAANLFGSTNTTPTPNPAQPSAAGSLFGNSSTASKPFGASTTSTVPSAGTLFGTNTGNNTNATSSSSLFGNNNNNTASGTSSAAGTLFGGAAAKPASSSGSLFGNVPSNNNTATSSAPSLFGNSMAAPATSAPSGGSLFGTSTNTAPGSSSLFGNSTTANNTAPGSNSLFGASTNTNAPGGSASLFGASTNTVNAPGSNSLFGNSAAPAQSFFGAPNNNSSMFGGASQPAPPTQPQASIFAPTASAAGPRPAVNHPGASAPQQTQQSIFSSSIGAYTASQAAVPGVRVDVSNLRPTTRFADLHETLQAELERLDALILQQHVFADECSQALPAVAEALGYVPDDAEFCMRKLAALQAALEADAVEIDALKTDTRKAADDAKGAFRNISALRTPAQYGGGSLYGGAPGPVPAGLLDGEDVASLQGRDLSAYMKRQVEEMEKKLDGFKVGLKDVESYLQGVEQGTMAKVQSAQLRGAGSGARKSADEQVRELASVLRDFEGGILSVAGRVGALRETTQQVMLDDSRARGRLSNLY